MHEYSACLLRGHVVWRKGRKKQLRHSHHVKGNDLCHKQFIVSTRTYLSKNACHRLVEMIWKETFLLCHHYDIRSRQVYQAIAFLILAFIVQTFPIKYYVCKHIQKRYFTWCHG